MILAHFKTGRVAAAERKMLGPRSGAGCGCACVRSFLCEAPSGDLPSLEHDPNRSEDVLKTDCAEDSSGGDDAADYFRYLVGIKSRVVA